MFTDDELRILKGMCEAADWPIGGKALLPLLARLEASEALNQRSALWHDGECEIMEGVMRSEEDCDCGSYAASRKWMESRGK
jgi:hypothetical protein